MKVTTNHPASVKGQPVILDNAGCLVDYARGVRMIRVRELGMSRKQLADALRVSWRTVEAWEQGLSETPNARALNALGLILEARK